MAHSEGKAVAELIREAVKKFISKPAYERSPFNLSVSSTEEVKRVYPRIAKSDWEMLKRISLRTNRFKAELIREAVDEYLTANPLI